MICVHKWKPIRLVNTLVMLGIIIFREKLPLVLIDCGFSNEYEVCLVNDKWCVCHSFLTLIQNKAFTLSWDQAQPWVCFVWIKGTTKGQKGGWCNYQPPPRACKHPYLHRHDCIHILHTYTGWVPHLLFELKKLDDLMIQSSASLTRPNFP